jgi:hypothetical protein
MLAIIVPLGDAGLGVDNSLPSGGYPSHGLPGGPFIRTRVRQRRPPDIRLPVFQSSRHRGKSGPLGLGRRSPHRLVRPGTAAGRLGDVSGADGELSAAVPTTPGARG